MRDWMKPGSNPGQGQGQGRSQASMAQAQSRNARDRADRMLNQAQQRASELAAGPTTGPQKPTRSWNTHVSQLGDELRQGRDNVRPEQ